MKLFVDEYPSVDVDLLAEHFEVVSDWQKADFWVFFSTFRYQNVPKDRSILVQLEPPLADHRLWLYHNHHEFHTVYTFTGHGGNVFPSTSRPQYFPYYPSPLCDPIPRPEDQPLTGKVYAAFNRYLFAQAVPPEGSYNLYPIRTRIVEGMMRLGFRHYVVGDGWERETKRAAGMNWRQRKVHEAAENDCDFILCFENCMHPNYISEKLHDGMGSGRVAVYLGCPNIEEYVPSDTFVNLNGFVDPKNGFVNGEGIRERLLGMSLDEYNKIKHTCSTWRDVQLDNLYREEREKLTRHIIARINGEECPTIILERRGQREEKYKAAEWYDQIYTAAEFSAKHYSPPWPSYTGEDLRLPVIARYADKDSEVIDVGCGNGLMAAVLRHEVNHTGRYTGLDFSEVQLERAQVNNMDSGEQQCRFLRVDLGDQRDVGRFGGPDSLFLFSEVLEHLPWDLEVLESVPAGAKIALTVPNMEDDSHIRVFSDTGEDAVERYEKVMTIEDHRILKRQGTVWHMLYGWRKGES